MNPTSTKLQPAPLPFPNGGALKTMASRQSESQKRELEAQMAQNEAKLARLKEKHQKENQRRTGAPRRSGK
jgi:hypothetical protein